MQMRTKGINYQKPPEWTQKLPRTADAFYINGHRRLYHNRISKLINAKGATERFVATIGEIYRCNMRQRSAGYRRQ